MRNAAHTIDVQEVSERERPSLYAHTITFWWTSAGLDYYLGYVPHLHAVKRSDMATFVNTYVSGQPFVFGVMVSPEMKSGGMTAAHFDSLLPPRKEAAR
jgi:zinc protease